MRGHDLNPQVIIIWNIACVTCYNISSYFCNKFLNNDFQIFVVKYFKYLYGKANKETTKTLPNHRGRDSPALEYNFKDSNRKSARIKLLLLATNGIRVFVQLLQTSVSIFSFIKMCVWELRERERERERDIQFWFFNNVKCNNKSWIDVLRHKAYIDECPRAKSSTKIPYLQLYNSWLKILLLFYPESKLTAFLRILRL